MFAAENINRFSPLSQIDMKVMHSYAEHGLEQPLLTATKLMHFILAYY